MSRKRMRKVLSAALGVLAFGSGSMAAPNTSAGKDISNSAEYDDWDQDGSPVDPEVPGNDDPENLGIDDSDNPGVDDPDDDLFGEDGITQKERDDLSNTMNDLKVKESEIDGRFIELNRKWQDLEKSEADRSRGDLATMKKAVQTSIDNASRARQKFFDNYNQFARDMSALSVSVDRLSDYLDGAQTSVNAFQEAVRQLENNIEGYKRDAAQDAANAREVETAERLNRSAKINSLLDTTQKSLRRVRSLSKSKEEFDINDRQKVFDGMARELSDVRSALRDNLEDGISKDDFNNYKNKLDNIDVQLKDIERELKNSSDFVSNYKVLSETMIKFSNMWEKYKQECSPKKVAVSGMSKYSVDQCSELYKQVSNVYSKRWAELQEKVNQAIKAPDQHDDSVDNLCKEALREFHSSILNSTRTFKSLQEFEASRHVQLSPAEYRQRIREGFVNECRRIRQDGEATRAMVLDDLVNAMETVLPGRRSFHRQMLTSLDKPVQIDASGRVDSTSLLNKNILLIGSPGNGKTEEARAAADALGLKIIYAHGDDFATEAASRDFYNNLLNETLNSTTRYVIFFDEIDTMFTNRALAGSDGDKAGAVTVFNGFLDRLQRSPEMMKRFAGLVATTNLATDQLDAALVSRFPQQLHVPKFDEDDARRFLEVELSPISITANTTKSAVIDNLARIMVRNQIDARRALNIIDEVWGSAKATSNDADGIGDDSIDDVIVHPDALMAGFSGMKIDGKKNSRGGRSR